MKRKQQHDRRGGQLCGVVMADLEVREWHIRHDDFEPFDQITLTVEPRWKKSGLSGAEWRFSVKVQFWFKGEVVHEHYRGNMKYAVMMLGAALAEQMSPIPDRVIAIEQEGKCDQPSCRAQATARHYLKEHFSSSGDKLDQIEQQWSRKYRQYCDQHRTRGDCSRSDSDQNYNIFPIEAGS